MAGDGGEPERRDGDHRFRAPSHPRISPSRKDASHHCTMPTGKCFYCSVDASVKSLKKCGACGSVISETISTFLSNLI